MEAAAAGDNNRHWQLDGGKPVFKRTVSRESVFVGLSSPSVDIEPKAADCANMLLLPLSSVEHRATVKDCKTLRVERQRSADQIGAI